MAPKKRIAYARWFFAVVVMAYLLQLASPLRLNTDSIQLLEIAQSVLNGEGTTYHGQPTQFPPGFPILIAAMDGAGLATSASFVGLNLLFLAASIAGLILIARHALKLDEWMVWAISGLSLLFWPTVKHATLPQTDVPFLGVGLLTVGILAAGERRTGRDRVPFLLAACIGAILAVSLRRNGIALLPAVAWVALVDRSSRAYLLGAVHRIVAAVGIAALEVFASWKIVDSTTSAVAHEGELLGRYFGPEAPDAFLGALGLRANEWFRIVTNLPSRALDLPELVTTIVGIFALALVCASLWDRRRNPSGVDVYFLGSLAILGAWPFGDARFWIPVLPIVIAYLFSYIRRLSLVWPQVGRAGLAYALAFSLAGFVALAWSTRISFAAGEFPDRYGDDSLRPTYRIAFSHADAASVPGVQPEALKILRRYEPRASLEGAEIRASQ